MSTASSDLEAVLEGIRASRLRKAGLRGPYASADCALGRRVLALARGGRGAYLFGEPGTGKTYAASCAVRLAVEASPAGPVPARIVTAARLLDEVRDGYGSGDGALGRAEAIPLLALDDLGAERPTEWAVETLTRLLDARLSAGLPTIVTSNHSVGGIRDLWGGVAGKRVASRLAGACERIEVAGEDRRLRVL